MYPNGARFAVQLSFDVEMVMNFPYWDAQWNHRKGAIDEHTKAYVRKIVAASDKYGAKSHFFLVGSLFEDPDVDYLKEVADKGHGIGNHTYTHVSIKANTPEALAGVYTSAPWRVAGRPAQEVVRDEIRMTSDAIRQRLSIEPKGFRSPGGFTNGLTDRPDVQRLLQDEGFWWVSTHYNDTIRRLYDPARTALDRVPLETLSDAFRRSEEMLQPYRYNDTGVIEIPLAGITDVVSWRGYRPDLSEWIAMLEQGVDFAYERGLIFMLTTHPAVLAAIDPDCLTVEAILKRATSKDEGVWLPDMEELAAFLKGQPDLRSEDALAEDVLRI